MQHYYTGDTIMITYWDKFMAGPTQPPAKRIHVTPDRKGVILMNRNAWQLLGSPKAAVLMFNKADSMIGVQSAHPQLTEAFPILTRVHGNWIINAAPFCRHHGI